MSSREASIDADETAVTLEKKLVSPGIKALEDTLNAVQSGKTNGKPQEGPSSYAPLIKKEHAKISWDLSAVEIDRKVRALIRRGAFCATMDGQILKILSARPLEDSARKKPGTVSRIDGGNGFVIECGKGSLLVQRVRPEGKNEMDAWDYLQGHPVALGEPL